MPTASLSPDSFQDVLARLPPDLDLDALARSTEAIQRRRRVGEGRTLLRLALARGPGGMSLNQTAAWASLSGIARLSDPGLKSRLDNAAPFFKAVMEHQLAALSLGRAVRWPGRCLRLVDGSYIQPRGQAGKSWLLHAGFDLGRGGFCHLELTDNRSAESIIRGGATAGEVRIADRNFANAKALLELREAVDGQADFIVRVRWKAFRLSHADGTAFDLIAHLKRLPPDREIDEIEVRAHIGAQQSFPLRLIIQRKDEAAAAAARAALVKSAPRKQNAVHPNSLLAAGFMILATSLGARDYPAREVLAVYRLRWQIELAFKRLKSLLHIDELPTRTSAASQSWLYAHLILALLSDDISQDFLESSP